MIIVFLVDVGISKYRDGYSLLDIAKLAIRSFVKQVNSGKHANNVKYILATSDRHRHCLKTEFHDPINTLFEQLELLLPVEPSRVGNGLSSVFELLSLRRITRHMDSFYRGRYVEHNETTGIFWFTDGKNLDYLRTTLDYQFGDDQKTPSSSFYTEKFRWEQKFHTFFLSTETYEVPDILKAANSRMRGQLYSVQNENEALHAIGNILGTQKDPYPHSKELYPYTFFATCGVMVNFVECYNTSADDNCLVQLYVDPAKHDGYYPIPENFWINSEVLRSPMDVPSLIRRTAIPTIYYWKENDFSANTYDVPSYLPRDSYVVSDCDMTRELQCQKPGTKWPVYVKDSGRSPGFGDSFGYLIAGKKNDTDMEVSLVILPYNYPILFKLLYQLRPEPMLDWKVSFETYRKNLPWYYLQPLSKVFAACSLDRTVDISLFTKPKTDGLDTLVNQIVQQLASPKLDEMRKDIVANRWGVTKMIPNVIRTTSLPEANYDVTSLLDVTSTIRREFRESLNAPIEPDSVNSVGTGDMGNFNKEEMIKMIKKDNFRNPFEEDNADAKKKDDKRAFGSPFKNPTQKPPYKWSLTKMSPGFRERLPSGLKPISFQGLPDLGIPSFVILPGRQLTTTIGSTTTKSRSIKLPKYPFDANNSKMQGHKSAGRLNFSSKPLTPPLTPTNGTFSSFSSDSSKMDLDENRSLDLGSNLVNDGVQTTDESQVLTDITIDNNNSLEVKSTEMKSSSLNILNTPVTNILTTNNPPPSSSGLEMLASLSTALKCQKITDPLINNLDVLNPINVNSKNSMDNDMNSEMNIPQKAVSIGIEPNGLDNFNKGDMNETQVNRVSEGRARSIKRVIRYRPLKNYEIFDLHSSKFAIEIRQQIQADSTVYNESNVINQLRQFAESKNYSQDSRIKFIKSIKEFAKASRKNNLLREVELIVNDLETDLSNSTDRSIKKVII
ncbi:protein ddx26b isoform x3 [Gigaspora margarita]|uniref:Protein ddx26b isoform x3 n=1 Tax=Gigaspora margarita TaxID=4874 RepID=A0A8H4A3E3_GIGMA|nr:protein ddx26b isoform x3 [Gigaspora margarita]